MIWRLRRLFEFGVRLVQRACPHPALRYVVDAFDFEYVCRWCDKRWFDEVPRLRRTVRWTGSLYRLDGEGGISMEQLAVGPRPRGPKS